MNQDRQPATIEDARQRLDELHAEAMRTKSSCKVVVEVTYQRGILQTVQDERRRYGR